MFCTPDLGKITTSQLGAYLQRLNCTSTLYMSNEPYNTLSSLSLNFSTLRVQLQPTSEAWLSRQRALHNLQSREDSPFKQTNRNPVPQKIWIKSGGYFSRLTIELGIVFRKLDAINSVDRHNLWPEKRIDWLVNWLLATITVDWRGSLDGHSDDENK